MQHNPMLLHKMLRNVGVPYYSNLTSEFEAVLPFGYFLYELRIAQELCISFFLSHF
jgi:hypothetical protein